MTPLTRTVPVLFAAAGATTLCATTLCATTFCLTATAHADPQPLNGIYTATANGQVGTWSIRSSCATEGCVANVNSSSGWNGVAKLTGGSWHMTVHNPHGFTCTYQGEPDGRTLPATTVYTIDASTLAGTVGYQDDGECKTERGWREEAITLTRAGD